LKQDYKLLRLIIPITAVLLLGLALPAERLNAETQAPAKKHAYITATLSSGLGFANHHGLSFGTMVESIHGHVSWEKDKADKNEIAAAWPLMFDLRVVSPWGFALSMGTLLSMSCNYSVDDANHLFFGVHYVFPVKIFDIAAGLLVFPVYIAGDELIAGRIDGTWWFIHGLGLSLILTGGGTSGWADERVLMFSASLGLSIRR
jgi:hypothetical protein